MAKNNVYMVPNLIAYDAMKRRAKELGMPDVMLEKNDEVLKYGFAELEHCRKAGVKMAYGSDLLGALENEQTGEFEIRGRVMPAIVPAPAAVRRSTWPRVAGLVGSAGVSPSMRR